MFVRKRRRRDSIRKPDTIDRILSSHSSLNPNEGSHEGWNPSIYQCLSGGDPTPGSRQRLALSIAGREVSGDDQNIIVMRHNNQN
jgi:hypothetical protein